MRRIADERICKISQIKSLGLPLLVFSPTTDRLNLMYENDEILYQLYQPYQLKTMNHIKIIDYLPEHQPYFEKLNKAWIEKDFTLEERDRFVLEQPDESILKPVGAIIMATYDGIIAGTVALLKLNSFEYEFTKMAVDENYRRKGIAEQLSYAAIEKAKQLGAKKIILYSQTVLTGAVPLYKKIGFVQVPIENGVYKRADVKMEMVLEKEEVVSNKQLTVSS